MTLKHGVLYKLLEKDTPFEFNEECHNAFKLLKENLTCAPVIVSPNWSLPFELLCDASDFAVGVILEFDIEIKDIKGTENVTANHLSRIKKEETSNDSEVDDNFLGETLMEINTEDDPWFADLANYLVSDIIPKGMTYQQKNISFSDIKHYFWEEPYLFKCMTRSSTNEQFTPYKEPKREFRSSRRHFKTLSLDKLRSLDFNLLYEQQYLEEEEVEAIAKTMEQYMSKT
ncbi:DNA-directed DNA polymerase [Tanacetum coccineum]|uniref:DNA-directed DNA polymerase n=1 Tax=Tanacetum coccineum TaxID=301880 RepID=A0ABQ5D4B5_9ASTR